MLKLRATGIVIFPSHKCYKHPQDVKSFPSHKCYKRLPDVISYLWFLNACGLPIVNLTLTYNFLTIKLLKSVRFVFIKPIKYVRYHERQRGLFFGDNNYIINIVSYRWVNEITDTDSEDSDFHFILVLNIYFT